MRLRALTQIGASGQSAHSQVSALTRCSVNDRFAEGKPSTTTIGLACPRPSKPANASSDVGKIALVTSEPSAGGEPTEGEVRADQELAVQIFAASVLAPLNLLGSPGAVLATIATPIATRIASFVVVKLSERRVRNAAETVVDAVEAAGVPLTQFTDMAVSDDRRHELLARTLTIAQDTALRDKRRALGRALAAGVMGDDAKIDYELLFIRAVADVDEMHIRLLSRMRATGPPAGKLGWDLMDIMNADPGLMIAASALLSALELHGLVARTVSTRIIPSATGTQTVYNVTPGGEAFLDRLTAHPEDEETAG